jgi:uncharacterized membrane protein
MTPDIIFQITNTFVLVGWFLLFVLPQWEYTQRIVLQFVVLSLAVVYILLVLPTLANFSPAAFMSLGGIKVLFQNETALLAGWIHYLAFDLFVGAYIVRQGQKRKIPRWQYTICLPFTFMLGPLGLVLFLALEKLKGK